MAIHNIINMHLASLRNLDDACEIKGEVAHIIIEDIDIMRLHSPQNMEQRKASVAAREKIRWEMVNDKTYSEDTRGRLLTMAQVPMVDDYVPPMERLLRDLGIDIMKPYRIIHNERTYTYHVFQNKQAG